MSDDLHERREQRRAEEERRTDEQARRDLDRLFPPIDPRYRRAVAQQAAEVRGAAAPPPVACGPDDLTETGDDWLGLLVVLMNSGWVLREQRTADGRVTLWADGTGYSHGVGGVTAADRALALFRDLYSDEPDAIACAAAFWPPTPPVTTLAGGER